MIASTSATVLGAVVRFSNPVSVIKMLQQGKSQAKRQVSLDRNFHHESREERAAHLSSMRTPPTYQKRSRTAGSTKVEFLCAEKRNSLK